MSDVFQKGHEALSALAIGESISYDEYPVVPIQECIKVLCMTPNEWHGARKIVDEDLKPKYGETGHDAETRLFKLVDNRWVRKS